jgi:hypothetical protein
MDKDTRTTIKLNATMQAIVDRMIEVEPVLTGSSPTKAVEMALTEWYQTKGGREMEEQAVQIRVEFSEDGLFGDWSDMDQYDVEASMSAYRDELETALEEAFRGADIDIVTGLDVVNNQMRLWVDGVEDLDLGYAELAEVVGDVYQSYGWVRYTEAGVREALDAGVWIERDDGIIVAASEVETDDGLTYELSWHRGPLPAHESRSYSTIDEAMEAMQRTHTGDWSDWRPRT